MGRKCKLQDTGETSNTDVAWKAPNGKYWSSEQAYIDHTMNQDYRMKSINYICDKLGGIVVPPFLVKRLKEYPNYEVVYTVLLDCNDSIEWAMKNKNFKSDTNAIQYIMAIIGNNYNDTYKLLKNKKKVVKAQEEKVIDDIDLDSIGKKNKKGSNVTSLLGDEDWI